MTPVLRNALSLCVAFVWLCASQACSQEWQQGPGCRFKLLPIPASGKTGFELLSSAQTGVGFTNLLPNHRSLTNTILPNGSGVAAGDIDGDGLCDIFFAGLSGGSRLYKSLGAWRFEDITERSGIVCSNLEATGVALADIDGNGSLDLLVNSIGQGAHIFFNDGLGKFKHGPHVLNHRRGGTALSLADVSGNGCLDLYIANYRISTILDAPGTKFTLKLVSNQLQVASINGRPPTDPEWTNRFRFTTEIDSQGRGRWGREELGEPDVLLRNDGHGNFEPVPWTAGSFLDEDGRPLSAPPFDWGLSALFRDFNQDGSPDLYVCNDFRSPDRFWINNGRGQFRAAPIMALRETSFSSMGADVADLNRDGLDELMVVDMLSPDHHRRLTQRNSMLPEVVVPGLASQRAQYPRNTLFLNRGDGTYAEIAQYAGVEASEWSWAPVFLDVDLDGYEDILIPNGFERDNMNVDAQNRIKQAATPRQVRLLEDLAMRALFPRLATANLAFRNCGNLRFEEVGLQWGFNTPTISQGTCLADLDNDGDLDVIANNMNAAAGLYRNQTTASRVSVRLRGKAPNTRGIGARISVFGGPVVQTQEIMCGGRYLSCDDAVRVFAAGAVTNRLTIQVRWRSGCLSFVSNALPNALYEIEESGAVRPGPVASARAVPAPLLADVSGRLHHVHADQPFDDFQRQPLLPKRLSRLGPGVAWWDVNVDGFEDLIIGSGKGGQLACYLNDGKGGFSRANQAPWSYPVSRDQTGIVGGRKGEVLVGSANYEDCGQVGGAVHSFTSALPAPAEMVPLWPSSVGPLAAVDYDCDGQLDLFVGGRVTGGHYPIAASSRLYRRGKSPPHLLTLDQENSPLLQEAGLVSGAVWSDLDQDGWSDLVLACEWGPLRVFRNQKGQLVNWDPPVTVRDSASGNSNSAFLSQFSGWWNGVTTGDFDGDGRMDILASNWGCNTRYERYRAKPLRLYYGDFADDGITQLIEVCYDSLSRTYVPTRMLETVTRSIPSLAVRFATYESWAQADIDRVLADRGQAMRYLAATWLETTLFLNRADHFESRILPREAQFAPAFAPCVADFNGDGCEDVFLSQNFFAVDNDTSRYDAGRGLLLLGNGGGGLTALSGQESGILIYGQQAGAATCDFNGDRRVDLIVTQNEGETHLLQNASGRPGVKIRLLGPEGNPYGVGAVIRLRFNDRLGSAREVHGGSGYWSQDSPVQVLGSAEPPSGVWVRWPGGRVTAVDLPAGAQQAEVIYEGQVTSAR